MVFTIPEHAKKLWDIWNIRAFIIISLGIQAFLILCAPLRKRRRGSWGKLGDILIWSAYLLADWVAGVTIGFILSNQIKRPGESGDLHAFWAPFLLLHLGGPETITSFSLEDNEFWIRHLLGLALQVASTLYIFLMSLPSNKLWLPTMLVLVSGIIKYAERNRAFYLASFYHLGNDWVPSDWGDEIPIPAEFGKVDNQTSFDPPFKSILWTAVHHFGTIKMALVGPFVSQIQSTEIRETFLQEKDPSNVLKILKIELSLLYEVLHTKCPVVGCKAGYFLRAISSSCIVGALWSFTEFKKHYKLGSFESILTYGLLSGALALDFISVIFFFFSDWFYIVHPRYHAKCWESRFKNRHRWSAAVSQLNFVTYYVKDDRAFVQEMADFLRLKSLLETVKGIRCLSSKILSQDQQEWRFIYNQVMELDTFLRGKMTESSQNVLDAKQIWSYIRERALESFKDSKQLIEDRDYTKSVLMWHIATELCFQEEVEAPPSDTVVESKKYKELCKLLSDYMFYLIVMQPAMMAAVSVSWKTVFKETLSETKVLVRRSSIKDENGAVRKILDLKPDVRDPERDKKRSVLYGASALANQLLGTQREGTVSWELVSEVWVDLMCFAAVTCRPQVHAQQPSKGGELLTFVWLLLNHLGLGTQLSAQY